MHEVIKEMDSVHLNRSAALRPMAMGTSSSKEVFKDQLMGKLSKVERHLQIDGELVVRQCRGMLRSTLFWSSSVI